MNCPLCNEELVNSISSYRCINGSIIRPSFSHYMLELEPKVEDFIIDKYCIVLRYLNNTTTIFDINNFKILIAIDTLISSPPSLNKIKNIITFM